MEPPPAFDVVPDPALGVAASRELLKVGVPTDDFWPSLGRSIAFAILFLAAAGLLFGSDGLPAAGFGYVCAYLWVCVFEQRRALRRVAGMWTSPAYKLEVDADGLSAKSDGGTFWRRWERATRLLERDEYVTIAFDGLETLTIPSGCFGSPDAREAWLGYVRGRIPATALESSNQ